jgi:hypothetical protein
VADNGVHICDLEPELAKQIQALVAEFTVCWEEKGLINMPEEEMMSVPLVDGWQNGKISAKVYPVGFKDREAINDVFDGLYAKDLMDWAKFPTPFGCAVFVVWKIVKGKRKARLVVNLRPLNKWAIPDAYPMPL